MAKNTLIPQQKTELAPYLEEIGKYPLLTHAEEIELGKKIELSSIGSVRAVLRSCHGLEMFYEYYQNILDNYSHVGHPVRRIIRTGTIKRIRTNINTVSEIRNRIKSYNNKIYRGHVSKIVSEECRERKKSHIRRAGVLLEEIVELTKRRGIEKILKSAREEYADAAVKLADYESMLEESSKPERKRVLNRISELKEKYGDRLSEKSKIISKRTLLWKESLDWFTNCNLRLVIDIAKKYQCRGVDLIDLVNEGNVGLTKAVKKYKWREGLKFSTYATHWIKQSIRRIIQSNGRIVKLPAYIIEYHNKMQSARKDFRKKHKMEPTDDDLASMLNIETKNIQNIKKVIEGRSYYLDQLSNKGKIITIEDFEKTTEAEDIDDSFVSVMHRVLHNLTEREREIIKLRFGLKDGIEYKLEQIGKKLGVTRERVRQIEAKALRKLRENPRNYRRLEPYFYLLKK